LISLDKHLRPLRMTEMKRAERSPSWGIPLLTPFEQALQTASGYD